MPKHADYSFMQEVKVAIRKRQYNPRNLMNFKISINYFFPKSNHFEVVKGKLIDI